MTPRRAPPAFLARPRGFNALVRSIDGLSNEVLSAGLDDLQDRGLVARRVVSDRPDRVEYDLTAAGRSDDPLFAAIVDWADTAAERLPGRWRRERHPGSESTPGSRPT